ncbi:conserved Plasmodium membrane protein, unknown function [Plasmodium gaboni]|uniref:Apicoplast integral membrane protein n=1 Tax=Plasmodium gaboni TaxID=647221 RepID=A0ABY1UNA2_9APIC|nr:conserved Plasmodium membrane protein, unknown function [Plasmodium gaboni]
MKKAIFYIHLIFFVFVNVTCLEVRRGKYNISYDYAIQSLRDNNFKRRGGEKKRRNNIYYMNINFHNIDNNFNNEIRKRHFNENDSIKDKLNKLKKLKNILNKYKLNINKKDIDKFKNRTQEIVVDKYHYAKKYSIIIINRLKDDMSIYKGKLKNYYNTTTTYLKDKYLNSSIHEYLSSIPFFSKSSNVSKLISYNSVNFLFLIFTILYFKSDYIYTFFKKKYAFIGEFKNIKTDKLVKIHTLSTLLFFFYKFFVLRLLFILNSYNFFSQKLYLINNLIHILFFSYISIFPYFLVQANWGSFHLLGSKKSKVLGGLVLLQLFLIYARLIFQNNLWFIKTWTDEQFFNKEEIIQNIKDDKKTDFYVKLLNQYDFLKRLYVGNNKIYEIVLYLYKYKYLLNIISPIHSLFYIYIAHSIYFYLNNLSFAGIYVSSFSLVLYLIKILSNKIDMYYLTKL